MRVTATWGDQGVFTGVERSGWWLVKIDGTFAWTLPRLLDTATVSVLAFERETPVVERWNS